MKRSHGNMVKGQVCLKGGGGGGVTWDFFYLIFFKVYHFYNQKLFYSQQNFIVHFEENSFFSVTIFFMKKSHSNLTKNERVCMCDEGWCVGSGQERGCLREGWVNFLKYLKRGWNRKEGRGNKIKKGGDNFCQGVGALKRRRLEPPYELWQIGGWVAWVKQLRGSSRSREFTKFWLESINFWHGLALIKNLAWV